MWEGIANKCNESYGMTRTAWKLHEKWQSLQREVQHILAANKSVNRQQRNGMSDENVEELAMKLYKTRVWRKDRSGNDVLLLHFGTLWLQNFYLIIQNLG